MGKFETINVEGVKAYTLFSKNSLSKVLTLDKVMPKYSFYSEGKGVSIEIYLDSPNNLLSSAGIILSKVIEEGKSYFRVEREDYLAGKKTLIPKEKKVFIHPIGAKDSVIDHTLFLIDGITSMFSTKFHIDLENVLKTIVPKLEIENKKNYFKIFSGKGFKADMIYENVFIKNYDTKRRSELLMLKIEQTSSKLSLDEFNDFTSKMEKYCKEILPINESKYEMAKRATKSISKK